LSRVTIKLPVQPKVAGFVVNEHLFLVPSW